MKTKLFSFILILVVTLFTQGSFSVQINHVGVSNDGSPFVPGYFEVVTVREDTGEVSPNIQVPTDGKLTVNAILNFPATAKYEIRARAYGITSDGLSGFTPWGSTFDAGSGNWDLQSSSPDASIKPPMGLRVIP